ncbi:MAG: GDP-mannose 4,6-dehydratase [Rhodobacteraceae bacterium]|nr:GDP-mannose 4,6-dehydratase [Paracoccaceae bacterium]
MTHNVLITGITGQDGAQSAAFLVKKGYKVHGIKYCASLFNTDCIDDAYQDPGLNNRYFIANYGDLTESPTFIWVIQLGQPDDIYNRAAIRHAAGVFETFEYTANALPQLSVDSSARAVRLRQCDTQPVCSPDSA